MIASRDGIGRRNMNDAGKAVFLSYASQDVAAVLRICTRLRATGIEVWFDQNELRGGDAWDAKIQGQIATCTLFVPVISAHTEARLEGYFRVEWKVAARRTHAMAEERRFLLPVVIDDTHDAAAKVPAEFKAVQWTRLPGGEASEEFCARVKRLLIDSTDTPFAPPARSQGPTRESLAAARRGANPMRRWIVAALASLAALVAVTVWRPWKHDLTRREEAEGYVEKAQVVIYDPDSGRNEFALAENLLKNATDLAPDLASAWGASALLDHYYFSRAYDVSVQARLMRSREEAEKALRLDPHCVNALLALGLHRAAMDEADRARQFLETARTVDPDNPRVILTQGLIMPDLHERRKFLLAEASRAAQPAELLYYAAVAAITLRHVDEGKAMLDRSLAARPFWRARVYRAFVEYMTTADPDRVSAILDQVPELRRDEPRVVVLRWRIEMLRGDSAAAVSVLKSVAADFFEDNFTSGPKMFLLAQARELGGQEALADEDWAVAAHGLREKLAAVPGDVLWRAMLAVALTRSNRDEAQRVADTCANDVRLDSGGPARPRRWREIAAMDYLAHAYVRLDQPERAVAMLRRSQAALGDLGSTPASLASEPRWKPLQGRPDFEALLVAAREDRARQQAL
jgi:tetratricopeptide (TPR) repeat protein